MEPPGLPPRDEQHFEVYFMQVRLPMYLTMGRYDHALVTWIYTALLAMLIVLMTWVLVRLYRKRRRITEPEGQPFRETYCSLSLALVTATQVGTPFLIIWLIYETVLIWLPPRVIAEYYLSGLSLEEYSCTELGQTDFALLVRIEQVLVSINYNLLYMAFYLQLYEWAAILTLLDSQKGKSVEEIAAEMSTGLVDAKDLSQQTFQQRERRLKWIGHLGGVAYLAFLLASSRFQAGAPLNQMAMTIAMLILFLRLRWNMSKFHSYEYKREKGNMWTQFLIIITLSLFLTFGVWIANLLIAPEEVLGICSGQFETGFKVFLGSLFKTIVLDSLGFFRLPNVVFFFNIAFIKRSSDILQGISKLDYLLKVSLFQRFKDQDMNRKYTLGSVQTFQSSSTVKDTLLDASASED